MRRRYVYDARHDKMAEVTEDWSPPQERSGPDILRDIKPYKSMIDGRIITSRSRHREHLKEHGCIEVGNEVGYMIKNRVKPAAPPGVRDALIRAAHKHGIIK